MNEQIAKLLAAFRAMHTSLNGMNLEGVPAALADRLRELKKNIDTALTGMPPTDQVPAALDAAQALNWMADRMRQLQEFTERVMSELTASVNAASGANIALNDLQGRVDTGELVPKAKITEALSAHVATMRERRTALCAAGLPVPSDDSLLCGTEDEWKLRLATAQTRKTALATKKIPEDKAVTLLFGAPEIFDTVLGCLPDKTATRSDKDPVVGAGSRTAPAGGTGSTLRMA